VILLQSPKPAIEAIITAYHTSGKKQTKVNTRSKRLKKLFLQLYEYAIQERIELKYLEVFSEYPTDRISDISNAEKREKGWYDHLSLVYGEVTCEALLKVILADISLPPKHKGVFIDIGSGSGRSLIVASLCHQWKCVMGVEILSSLHNIAIEVIKKWECMYNYKQYDFQDESNNDEASDGLDAGTRRSYRNDETFTLPEEFIRGHPASYFSTPSSTSSGLPELDITLNESDIDLLEPPTSPIALYQDDLRVFDWSNADVLFVNSTCFDGDLMYELRMKCSQLRLGSYILMLTKRLQHSQFRRLSSHSVRMSWGESTIHVYLKIHPATAEYTDVYTEE
jgi:hypothetical protein